MKNHLIDDCYNKSTELLLNNSSLYGILACNLQKKAKERDYLSIFARDASICSLGMIASKNKALAIIAKRSLKTLAKNQAPNGEIPNYVKPQKNISNFWQLGSIDATLWWLIAVDFYHKNSNDKKLKPALKKQINKALDYLSCQEHNNDYLLKQGEASDWADIMPRNGKVLYSNALWYKVKSIYNLYEKEKTKRNFNIVFKPHNFNLENVPKSDLANVKLIQKSTKEKSYYISFLSYLYWGHDIDVYGNSLAILAGLPSQKFAREFTDMVGKKKKLAHFPAAVLYNPIKENSSLWRKYMESHHQNFPYQYHNGGTWPFASCFFACALKTSGQKTKALEELERIAELNKVHKWGFNEWFHTKTGHAHGMHGQSWNAGAFLFAYHYIHGDIIF